MRPFGLSTVVVSRPITSLCLCREQRDNKSKQEKLRKIFTVGLANTILLINGAEKMIKSCFTPKILTELEKRILTDKHYKTKLLTDHVKTVCISVRVRKHSYYLESIHVICSFCATMPQKRKGNKTP